MKRFYLLFFLFALGLNPSIAQSRNTDQKDSFKNKGDKEFMSLKYSSAISFYLFADTTNINVINNLAKSYHNVKDYYNAEKWYRKAVQLPGQDNELFLSYAEVLANNSKYELAEKWYQKYAAIHQENVMAKNLSQLYKDLNSFYKDSVNWKVYYPSFNTSQGEFSPAYFNKGLIFSSNRGKKWGITNAFGWTQTAFTDLFIIGDTSNINYLEPKDYFFNSSSAVNASKQRLPFSANDNKVLGDIAYPKAISDVLKVKDSSGVKILKNRLNTRFHDGPVTFSNDQSYMVYNRNHKKTSREENAEKGIQKLNLYTVNHTNGKWINKQPFKLNNVDFSIAHPALTSDNKTLYFVSDMPGGYGGKDIYYTARASEDEDWGSPVNLGKEVNTEGDEVFPYVASDGNLYFSSNGHTGLGGLDIFIVELENNVPFSKPKNIGYPINSSKDDFGIVMLSDKSSGYFSSNRYGSDDVLKFDFSPVLIDLKGSVYAATDDKIIDKALVRILYDNKIDTLYSDNQGSFDIRLQPGTHYIIDAVKKGYSSTSKELNTNGITKSTGLEIALVLVKNEGIVDCEKLKVIPFVKSIYYDLDKSNIRPDAELTLNRLIEILKLYPALKVSLASHTDSRASDEYNVSLSDRRAKSVIAYLTSRGITKDRLSSEYYGKTKLQNRCADGVDCTEEEQQINRRTEINLIYNGENITEKCEL